MEIPERLIFPLTGEIGGDFVNSSADRRCRAQGGTGNPANENPPESTTSGAGRDLACPVRTNLAFEHKRQFPELSSPRRFAFELPRYIRPKPIFAFLALQTAVDALQETAAASGLTAAVGQDAIQRILDAAGSDFHNDPIPRWKDEYIPPP